MAAIWTGLSNGQWLQRDRIIAYPLIIIALLIAATSYVLISNNGLLPNGSPFGADFVSYWVAAREALAGHAHVPYLRDLFEPVQQALFPESGYFAFFYPPHYLLYMLPFGLLPYYPALIIWMVASFAGVCWVLVRITRAPKETVLLALAFPAAYLTISQGQNAFFSAALFGCGLYLLPKRPILAGIAFGLLTFKPQLGLLIPLALIAGGYWRTILAAGATLVLIAALSVLVLSLDVWSVFITQSSNAVETMREGLVAWEKMISPYAAMRIFGLSDGTASIIHWLLAACVAASVVWVWRQSNSASYDIKAALLLTASLIVTPFSLNYDLYLLAPAMAFLATRGIQSGFMSFEKSVLALTYLSPILVLLTMSEGYSPACLFVLVFLVLVLRRCCVENKMAEKKAPHM